MAEAKEMRRSARQTQIGKLRGDPELMQMHELGEASRQNQNKANGALSHLKRHYTTSSHGVQQLVSAALRRSIADAYAAVVAQVG